MIDLSKIVPLSSNDVTVALFGFFRINVVGAVIGLVIALLLYPYINRALRWLVLAPIEREPYCDVIDERNDPGWVTVPGDLPGLNMEYEKATGYGFSWNESTREERNQAAAASGDYSLLQFSWEGQPSHDVRNEDGEVVARVYDPS